MRIHSLVNYSGHFSKTAGPVKFAGVLYEQQSVLDAQKKQQQDAIAEQERQRFQEQMDRLSEPFLKEGDIQWSKLRLLKLVAEMSADDTKSAGNITAWVLSPLTIIGGVGFGLFLAANGIDPFEVPGAIKHLLPTTSGSAPKDKLMALFTNEATRKGIEENLCHLVATDRLLDSENGKYSLTPQGREIVAAAW